MWRKMGVLGRRRDRDRLPNSSGGRPRVVRLPCLSHTTRLPEEVRLVCPSHERVYGSAITDSWPASSKNRGREGRGAGSVQRGAAGREQFVRPKKFTPDT